MIRHLCFLCVAACSSWAVVVMMLLTACSGGGGGKNDERPDSGAINLFLGRLQVPSFDSISVIVSAANMENIHVSANSIKDSIKIDGIPFGQNRKFEVKIYAEYGKMVQKGEAVADINAGETATIPISLKAFYSFLRLEVPLGLANTNEIYSGKLYVGDLEFQMQIENGKGIFNTSAIPLNQTLALRLELKNAKGETIFTGQKQITFYTLLQTETMQLEATRGSAILELNASSEGPMQVLAFLPTSTKRKPEHRGDLFFTEIFADPKANGESFEYMEIYNATLDTLELSQCHIKHASSTFLYMPENLILPPMEYLFFGSDSVANADFNYEKSFKLNNGGENLNLAFYCGDAVIDSLRYTSPFPLKRGTAMQLPLANFNSRADGSSWCLGFSPKQDTDCQ